MRLWNPSYLTVKESYGDRYRQTAKNMFGFTVIFTFRDRSWHKYMPVHTTCARHRHRGALTQITRARIKEKFHKALAEMKPWRNSTRKTMKCKLKRGKRNHKWVTSTLNRQLPLFWLYNMPSQQRTRGLQPENGRKTWFFAIKGRRMSTRGFSGLAIKITFHFNSGAHAGARAEIRNERPTQRLWRRERGRERQENGGKRAK